MSNLNLNFKEILENLEKNIKDKEDLEYAKVQIFNLYNLFFEEISNLEELANSRISEIARTQKDIDDKLKSIEKGVRNIQEDIYDEDEYDEDEDYEFTIECPYCDSEFTIDLEEAEDTVICPECKKTIELDWGHECSCGCEECEDDCACEDENCKHIHNDEDDDM